MLMYNSNVYGVTSQNWSNPVVITFQMCFLLVHVDACKAFLKIPLG